MLEFKLTQIDGSSENNLDSIRNFISFRRFFPLRLILYFMNLILSNAVCLVGFKLVVFKLFNQLLKSTKGQYTKLMFAVVQNSNIQQCSG